MLNNIFEITEHEIEENKEFEHIVERIKDVSNDYDEIVKLNRGDKFNSSHEGYGVLLEEVIETGTEFDIVRSNLEDLFVNGVMTDSEDIIGQKLLNIYYHSVNACAELIQVIAVTQKFLNTIAPENSE